MMYYDFRDFLEEVLFVHLDRRSQTCRSSVFKDPCRYQGWQWASQHNDKFIPHQRKAHAFVGRTTVRTSDTNEYVTGVQR